MFHPRGRLRVRAPEMAWTEGRRSAPAAELQARLRRPLVRAQPRYQATHSARLRVLRERALMARAAQPEASWAPERGLEPSLPQAVVDPVRVFPPTAAEQAELRPEAVLKAERGSAGAR